MQNLKNFIKELSENLDFLETVSAISAIVAIGGLCAVVFWVIMWLISGFFIAPLPHNAYQSLVVAVIIIIIAVIIYICSIKQINKIIDETE